MFQNKLTLTAITSWLNENFEKKNNTKFSISDVQGYIRRGKLPNYLGGNKIELVKEITCTKLYNVK